MKIDSRDGLQAIITGIDPPDDRIVGSEGSTNMLRASAKQGREFETLPNRTGYGNKRFGRWATASLTRPETENLAGNLRHLTRATASGVPVEMTRWVIHC
jgi:hypothetical protein